MKQAFLQDVRRRQLMDLYRPDQTACDCSRCAARLSEFSNRFRPIDKSDEEDYLRQVHGGKAGRKKLHKSIYNAYYKRLRQFSEAGYGRRLDDARTLEEFQLMELIKRNLSHFAGLKNQSLASELLALKRLPLNKFLEEGGKIMRRYNRDYLEAELVSAMASAQSAESWTEIQRRKFLYPNLRYETAGDERVRESHRSLDQAVYPVDHPFWDSFMPPNGYRCRCKVVQTDQPAKEGIADFLPEKGFRNNPGKTGLIFEEDHPYFSLDASTLADIKRQAENLRAAWEAAKIRFAAVQKYAGARLSVQGLSKPMEVTAGNISSIIASPDVLEALRNDLLTALGFIAPQLRFVSASPKGYIYRLEILGQAFQFVIAGESYYLTEISSL